MTFVSQSNGVGRYFFPGGNPSEFVSRKRPFLSCIAHKDEVDRVR
jgi:hypothetical protein